MPLHFTQESNSGSLCMTGSNGRTTEERWSITAGHCKCWIKTQKIHRILNLLEILSVLPGEGEVGPVCSCTPVPYIFIF